MRSLIKYLVIVPVLALACIQANAQSSAELSVGYQINIPAGSFRNYITTPAYRGFNAALAFPLNDQLSLGLLVAHNDFYQKYPRAVYPNGDGSSVSAVISNSVQETPLMLTASYTILKRGFIRPYIAAGGGLNLISFDQYLGQYDNPDSRGKFTAMGDAGFYIPLGVYSATSIKIGANYQYAPYEKGVNLDNWGIHAGVAFKLR
jgi:hypothetical protein